MKNRFGPVFWRFLAVLVRFFLYFQTRQPVAVPVHPKKAKKLDWTGPLFTMGGSLSKRWPFVVVKGGASAGGRYRSACKLEGY